MKDTGGLATVLLLIVMAVRTQLSGVAYPYVQGLLLVPVLVALALLLLSPADDTGRGGEWREWALLPPWILCLWSFTSLMWSTDPGRGVEESVALLLNVSVFTLLYTLWSKRLAGKGIWMIGLWILLLPVILRGAYQYYFGLERIRHLLRDMGSGGENVGDLMGIISGSRIFAGFLNSNMLAGFLAIFVPVTLDLTLTSTTRRSRLAWGFLVLGQSWILLLTGSIGGTLAAAAGSAAVLMIRRGVHRRELFWMGSAGVVILAALVMVRGFDLSPGPDNSLIQRVGYMRSGVMMALVRPLSGWGTGSGPGALMGFVTEGIRPVADPHNFLIRSWISWGLPGIVLLSAFFLLWSRKVLPPLLDRSAAAAPGGHIGFVFGVLAFLLHSLMDMDFFVPETAMFGWAAFGACLGTAAAPERGGPDPAPVPSTTGLKVLGAAALALVLPTLIYVQAEFTGFRAARDLEAGMTLQSAERYREARRLLPFNGRFILEEGRSRRAAGQLEEAVTLFERASDLLPYSPYPSWEMGRVALEQGKWEAAIDYLSTALLRYPTSPRIRLDLAQAHYELGRYEETVELLREVERLAIFDREARAVARNALHLPDPGADQ